MEIIVAKVSEIPVGTGKKFVVKGKTIAIFNVDGKFYAIDDTCSHAEASLSEGELEGKAIVCPWHGAKFDLESGWALTLPAVEGLKTYTVTVEGEAIKLTLKGS